MTPPHDRGRWTAPGRQRLRACQKVLMSLAE